jgi:hypothetical protein
MKINKNQSVTLLFISLVFFSNTVFSVSFFGSDKEDIIWKGAPNNYFKYEEQDDDKFGKNDHPVELEEKEIIDALTALEYSETNILGAESISAVFSYSQIRLLAEYLSKGLDNAQDDQDIIFVIGGKATKLLVLTEKTFLAGRAFYKNKKLNIIIGEFDFPRNTATENLLDPGNTGEIAYNFDFGSRTSNSRNFKAAMIGIPGVKQNTIKGKLRPDWLEIDIKLAAEAYLARKNERENPSLKQDQALKIEAAKLAKQRREMRSEMARLRKDMEERTNDSSSVKSIEERISTLDKLLEKKLISKEEYAVKRKEILNDI